MKPSELRVGNWIEWQDDSHEQFQVESIEFASPNWYINGGLLVDMLPIPLTEEWLVRAGFNKNEYSVDGVQYSEPFFHPKLEAMGWVVRWIDTWAIHPIRSDYVSVKIQYVHQLQNLYFALTGQELEFASLA